MLRSIDRRPAAIVRPVDADEVRRVVSLARETGVELAVRGGGHSYAGHSTSEGGIVLDLRGLTALEIDPGERVVRAGGGLTSGEVTTAAASHGLAVGFGDTPTVGIGGLTLGGGAGYLVRKHGLTIDQLLGAEVVTADGRVLEVDETREPDLFWAIRGGGGNFGVVTRFDYRLHSVDTVTGGMLAIPATPETLAGLVEVADAAPEELSLIANVLGAAPPLPFVPAELVGKPLSSRCSCTPGRSTRASRRWHRFARSHAGRRLRAGHAVRRDVRAGGAGGAAPRSGAHVLLRFVRRARTPASCSTACRPPRRCSRPHRFACSVVRSRAFRPRRPRMRTGSAG